MLLQFDFQTQIQFPLFFHFPVHLKALHETMFESGFLDYEKLQGAECITQCT